MYKMENRKLKAYLKKEIFLGTITTLKENEGIFAFCVTKLNMRS